MSTADTVMAAVGFSLMAYFIFQMGRDYQAHGTIKRPKQVVSPDDEMD